MGRPAMPEDREERKEAFNAGLIALSAQLPQTDPGIETSTSSIARSKAIFVNIRFQETTKYYQMSEFEYIRHPDQKHKPYHSSSSATVEDGRPAILIRKIICAAQCVQVHRVSWSLLIIDCTQR